MNLKTMQGLLVLSAALWAFFPWYGAPVYASAFVLLLVSTALLRRRVRTAVEARAEELSKVLTPEAAAWVQRFSFFYARKDEAKARATTFKMASLLVGLLALWFVARALVFVDLPVLFLLIPCVGYFFAGVMVGGRLEVDELVNEDAWAKHKRLHEEAEKVLTLKAAAGQWPP